VTLRYRAIPLSEIVIDLDHTGRVDTVYRCFKLTARQAMQIPGWADKLPRGIKAADGARANDLFRVCPLRKAERWVQVWQGRV
jgi:hypothetical protein